MAERTGLFGKYYGSTQGGSVPLTFDEMTVNAKYIRSYLTSKGWTDNAIFAILGNMHAESTMNPGRWQNNDVGNPSVGYGLVQWTPATKYIEWCEEQNLGDYSTMDNNLSRIIYEVENNLQWIPADNYIWQFEEWTRATAPVDEMARAFMLCYERPKDQSEDAQAGRARLALYWLENISSEPVTPETPTVKKSKKRKFNFLLFSARSRRENQWIRNNF